MTTTSAAFDTADPGGPDPAVRTFWRGLSSLIRRHPLVSYFVLADTVSWLAWLPYVVSRNGLGLWNFRFPDVLGTSQVLGVLPGAYLGPIASALLVTAVADGRPGLRRWLARMWHWRVRWPWYATALIGVPAAMLAVGFAFSGGRVEAPSSLVLAAYLPGLLLQMISTGLAEEPGWRDFALPRLQTRFGPLRGSMVLGPLWALWHLPLFLSSWGGWPDAGWTRPVAFCVFCLAFNLVITWVFNRSGQSLPLTMLTHVSANNFASIVWSQVFPTIDADRGLQALAGGAVVAAVIVLLSTRGRLGWPGAEAGTTAPEQHDDEPRGEQSPRHSVCTASDEADDDRPVVHS